MSSRKCEYISTKTHTGCVNKAKCKKGDKYFCLDHSHSTQAADAEREYNITVAKPESPVRALKVTTTPRTLQITKNKYNHYVHTILGTTFIIDPKDSKVYAVELSKGEQRKPTDDEVKKCMEYGMKYKDVNFDIKPRKVIKPPTPEPSSESSEEEEEESSEEEEKSSDESEEETSEEEESSEEEKSSDDSEDDRRRVVEKSRTTSKMPLPRPQPYKQPPPPSAPRFQQEFSKQLQESMRTAPPSSSRQPPHLRDRYPVPGSVGGSQPQTHRDSIWKNDDRSSFSSLHENMKPVSTPYDSAPVRGENTRRRLDDRFNFE
jgi:type IV secretory pathway VirB10-like protein